MEEIKTDNINVNIWDKVKVSKEEIPSQQNINITVEQKEKSIMWIL